MSQFQYFLSILAGGLCLIALALPFGVAGTELLTPWSFWPLGAFLVVTFLALALSRSRLHPALPGCLAVVGGVVLLVGLGRLTPPAASGYEAAPIPSRTRRPPTRTRRYHARWRQGAGRDWPAAG